MKTQGARRPYRMGARAAAVQATERRILDAARRLFSTRWYDDVTLADVADAAEVSSQTVIRRFGSKDGLIEAVAAETRTEVAAQRGEAPAGDVAAAIANLLVHYEREGDAVLHLLAQEGRVPAYRRVTDDGRALHHAWVDRVFADRLAAFAPAERARRRAGLIAACDVYVWKVLRRDLGLAPSEAQRVIADLVTAQLPGA